MADSGLGFWRRVCVGLVLTTMGVLTRPDWRAGAGLPDGGVILAANHLSHFDPLVLAHWVYRQGRWPQFLAKASIFGVPGVGFLMRRARQIPVERGSVEAAKSLDTLVAALAAGGVVIIYPEGTTTKSPELWPMRGKTGAARLALLTGAPVIPIATDGAQAVFDPRTGRFTPRWRAPMSVLAGPPVDLSRWRGATPTRAVLDGMTDAIMNRIGGLLGELRGVTPPPLYERPAASGPRAAAGPGEPAPGGAA